MANKRSGLPTIYYLAPSTRSPIGGIHVLYRHVDALNAGGIAAAIVHEKAGYRAWWFANSTRFVYCTLKKLSKQLTADDFVVLLEVTQVAAILKLVPFGHSS